MIVAVKTGRGCRLRKVGCGCLRHPARLVVAALLIVLQAGLLPFLLALVASADAEHRAEVRLGAHGPELVLHHDRAGAPSVKTSCGHHHGLVARWLAGKGLASDHPDHVVPAGTAADAAEQAQTASAPTVRLQALPEFVAFAGVLFGGNEWRLPLLGGERRALAGCERGAGERQSRRAVLRL